MVESPVGCLKLVASDDGLAAILWENDVPLRFRLNIVAEDINHPVLLEAERQLKEYFSSRREAFDLKLDFAGTEFQKEVWRALLTIPFGETRSYGQIAKRIGRPSSTQAVGAAIGRNPLSIVAPCHRVIGWTGAHGVSPAAYRRRLICCAWRARRPNPSGASTRKRTRFVPHRRVPGAHEFDSESALVRVLDPRTPTSAVTRCGDTIYLSGLPPFDPDTGEIEKVSIERQTESYSTR
jgi:methylated-DNA-[protein]-cysteine S-methyltransferase